MDENFFDDEELEKQAKRPTYASTEGQVGERERQEAAVAGPLKAPKKSIVTKEEMKKAGFDNLRDYLNFKQGKERRKEEEKGPSDADLDRMMKKFEGHMGKSESEKKMGVFGARGKNPSPANPSKFKKGGLVSSASKRADGIAVKGKTKGRIV